MQKVRVLKNAETVGSHEGAVGPEIIPGIYSARKVTPSEHTANGLRTAHLIINGAWEAVIFNGVQPSGGAMPEPVFELVEETARVDKLINLTPHPITFLAEDGATVLLELPKCDDPARASEQKVDAGLTAYGIQSFEISYGESNLPDPVEGTGYIVSMLVAQTNPGRTDLFFPGDVVRNVTGDIMGCKSLNKV